MGKGSNRREFNKDRERAFRKRYQLVYKFAPKPNRGSRAVYVVKGQELVAKEARS